MKWIKKLIDRIRLWRIYGYNLKGWKMAGQFQSQPSSPYVIQIVNTSETESGTANIFGFNLFANKKNLGSSENIKITNLCGGSYGVDYFTILAESQKKTIFEKIRFQCSAGFDKLVYINHCKGDGKVYSMPWDLKKFLSPYQVQSNIVDVEKKLTVQGGTYMSVTLNPNERMVISYFPERDEN